LNLTTGNGNMGRPIVTARGERRHRAIA